LGNVTNPRSLTGLLCGIAYEWQVRSVCSNTSATSNSSWSSSSFFTTTSCQNVCPAPAGTTTSGITVSSANVSWNAVTGAASYTVRYRVAGSATWAFKNSTVTSTSLNNLICGTAYEWQVRSNCATASNTTSGSYSVSSTFTTTSCTTVCPAPSGLAATGITSSGATLSWSTTGANAYQVRYRENVAGSVWTFQQTNGLSISIAGLNPATQYVWQVQSLCSNGTISGTNSSWSVQSYFQTLAATSTACPVPTGLTVTSTSTAAGVYPRPCDETGAGRFRNRIPPGCRIPS
jgi:hypothetical protein